MSLLDPSATLEVNSRSALRRTGSIGHRNTWARAWNHERQRMSEDLSWRRPVVVPRRHLFQYMVLLQNQGDPGFRSGPGSVNAEFLQGSSIRVAGMPSRHVHIFGGPGQVGSRA